jgi:hypothetical protein
VIAPEAGAFAEMPPDTYAVAGLVSSALANEHCSFYSSLTSLRKPTACSPSGSTAPPGWQLVKLECRLGMPEKSTFEKRHVQLC